MKCSKILLSLALAALPLVAAAPAHAAKKMEVMVQDDGIFLYNQGYYDRDAAYQQLRRMGATRLRMNLYWANAMPAAQANAKRKPRRIAYDWSLWDNAVDTARAYGIKVQLAIGGRPPAWATGNKKPPGGERIHNRGHKPNAKAFGQFARAAARHFGRRVDRYSIWNEPNWYTWLSPLKQAPKLYRKLYLHGYKGIKRGNRRAKVFMGETAPHAQRSVAIPPAKFIREMFCVTAKFKRVRGAKRKCPGRALKVDGFAHHPYDFVNAPKKKRPNRDDITMANLGTLTSTLDRLQRMRLLRPSARRVPIYLTEHGYFVRGPRRIPERRRAKWTVQAFNMAQRNPRVKAMLYFVFVSPPVDSPWSGFDLGLIAENGTPRRTYNKLRGWVRKAQRTGRVAKPRRCAPAVRSRC